MPIKFLESGRKIILQILLVSKAAVKMMNQKEGEKKKEGELGGSRITLSAKI